MIRKTMGIGIALLAASITTGCLGVASPAIGILSTNVKWAGDAEGPVGSKDKEGKACARSILALIAEGDASIDAAARNGGITNVTSVDHETTWTLIYGKVCTIVRGT